MEWLPRRGWSPLGRVRKWDERGGPAVSVCNLVQAHSFQGAVWQLTANHMEDIWGYYYNITRRGIADPDPLEFAAKVARHARECRICGSKEGVRLWRAALKHTGVDDIVKAIMVGYRTGGAEKTKKK